MTDVVADMLTRIRNGQKSRLISVMVPFSKERENVLMVLKNEGYISDTFVHEVRKNIYQIEVMLKYLSNGNPVIDEISKISKPGRRFYSSIKKLKEYRNGMGTIILSTSKGIMSDKDARRLNLGGELICKVF